MGSNLPMGVAYRTTRDYQKALGRLAKSLGTKGRNRTVQRAVEIVAEQYGVAMPPHAPEPGANRKRKPGS